MVSRVAGTGEEGGAGGRCGMSSAAGKYFAFDCVRELQPLSHLQCQGLNKALSPQREAGSGVTADPSQKHDKQSAHCPLPRRPWAQRTYRTTERPHTSCHLRDAALLSACRLFKKTWGSELSPTETAGKPPLLGTPRALLWGHWWVAGWPLLSVDTRHPLPPTAHRRHRKLGLVSPSTYQFAAETSTFSARKGDSLPAPRPACGLVRLPPSPAGHRPVTVLNPDRGLEGDREGVGPPPHSSLPMEQVTRGLKEPCAGGALGKRAGGQGWVQEITPAVRSVLPGPPSGPSAHPGRSSSPGSWPPAARALDALLSAAGGGRCLFLGG